LNKEGITEITDAAQAARALEPLAGTMAKALFAIGLVGAALLAASILPLSTAYSVGDLTGQPAALDDGPKEAPLFYATFGVMTVFAAGLILIPDLPLIKVLVFTQILNAVLLLPLLIFMYGISKDERLMGEFASTRRMRGIYGSIITLVSICVLALLWLSINP
jgi:Mn2+/Fe2+ NRAMP family transporter